MDMSRFEIVYFELDNGDCPVADFIDSLDVKMKAKVFMEMSLLEELGNQLRLPYSEHLEDGIFELRAKVGSNISRVLYFFFSGRKIILTNGFIKKTQKTPKEEKELAKKYKEIYERRENR